MFLLFFTFLGEIGASECLCGRFIFAYFKSGGVDDEERSKCTHRRPSWCDMRETNNPAMEKRGMERWKSKSTRCRFVDGWLDGMEGVDGGR